MTSGNEPIKEGRGDDAARSDARKHAPVEDAGTQTRLQQRACEKNEEIAGKAVFAEEAYPRDETEQEVVADPSPLCDPHEGPHRGRDGADQRHGVGHALMQVPADLVEEKRRQRPHRGPTEIGKDPLPHEIEKGEGRG